MTLLEGTAIFQSYGRRLCIDIHKSASDIPPFSTDFGRRSQVQSSPPPATRLPTPETAFSLCAGMSGNGGQDAWLAPELQCWHPPATRLPTPARQTASMPAFLAMAGRSFVNLARRTIQISVNLEPLNPEPVNGN